MRTTAGSQSFHFTLGPVQGFVAQARRTRDFWAGSFILSWLSSVAMKAVQGQGGTIIFPEPDQAFLHALENGGSGPKQGNVPNRFKARVESNFDPKCVEAAVRGAWTALAEAVWQADLAHSALGSTRAIWERQIGAFWDIQWVLEEGDDTSAIDRLKNWRTQLPPPEPGVKCMMMDGWQELSGAPAPGRRPDDPGGPDTFWKKLRESGKPGIATDLRPGEMLCAIAYVKRRFVRCFETLTADLQSGLKVHGWKLPAGVPSVQYLAAAPWLAQLLKMAGSDHEFSEEMGRFHDAARRLTGEYGEWDSNIVCVKDADAPRRWKALDGTVFFDTMLENANLWGEQADDAIGVLRQLKTLRTAAKLDPVSPFYAVLLMDGDRLGELMGDRDKQQVITKALGEFTGEVPRIIEKHSGFLVYAGGDDVLALLPLEDALACAADLRQHYMCCFAKADSEMNASISGAIEYAHIKMPLGKVLGDAHSLLDDVAKEARGRDAIACRVWKPGGLTLEWAMPWEYALGKDDHGQVEVVIEKLARDFRAQNPGGDGGESFSSKFFYRIRERFELLNPAKGGGPRVLDDDQVLSLLAMEYLNSGPGRGKGFDMSKARDLVRPLLDQCRPVTRNRTKPMASWKRDAPLRADGALLVRFLANKGIER